jgi:hypothetical protein
VRETSFSAVQSAAFMARERKGLLKWIRDKYKTALLVKCYARKLFLMPRKPGGCMSECNVIFETLYSFSVFALNHERDLFDKLVTRRLSSVVQTFLSWKQKLSVSSNRWWTIKKSETAKRVMKVFNTLISIFIWKYF